VRAENLLVEKLGSEINPKNVNVNNKANNDKSPGRYKGKQKGEKGVFDDEWEFASAEGS